MSGWGKLPTHQNGIERHPRNLKQLRDLLSFNQVHHTVFNPATYELFAALSKLYGMPRLGYTRGCFRMGNGWVLKVAYNQAGANQCHRELSHYQHLVQTGQGVPIPATHWADLSVLPGGFGHVGLMAEEVRLPSQQEVNYWYASGTIGNLFEGVDHLQIGVTRNGRIVAYDL